ncbi:hypothetical protein [Clostridium akagii]|nr:hypothetical protein [Clostridium akagii]
MTFHNLTIEMVFVNGTLKGVTAGKTNITATTADKLENLFNKNKEVKKQG